MTFCEFSDYFCLRYVFRAKVKGGLAGRGRNRALGSFIKAWPRAGILSIDSHHPLTEILTILCYILCLLTETTRKCDDFLDCRRVSFCRATDVVRRLDFHLHGQH